MNDATFLKDFPIFSHQVGEKRLVYLDNAATNQHPACVLEAMDTYYRRWNANPHRGVYRLSSESTKLYEGARQAVADFIHSKSSDCIVFTRNTTESLNLLSWTYARMVLQKGDEIVIPVSEHHSNMVPWQQACKATGASLVFLYPDSDGIYSEEEIEKKISSRTKIVSFALVGNVLGLGLPAEKLIKKAHSVGAIVIADCAQSIGHTPLDVSDLDVDFAAFSGHKMFGPMGIGVLYGKWELLEAMPPFLTGGDMIEYVQEQESSFAPIPQRFEAGTPDVAAAVGLQAAIEYIKKIGYKTLREVEAEVTTYALERLSKFPWIKMYGKPLTGERKFPIITFTVEGIHPHDVASILDEDGISIRAGHHCAQPLMHFLQVPATCRVSFSIYNTKADIDALVVGLLHARRVFGYEH
ncbi:SufS family cysteine desulfurase [uncultured Sphaerochaeta sp.]|uniref:SufS family cysteine desulfurase n=1 Tax=uncultured Sphaerochaeta sp. TaxID=886478 RepID=UPI002A0A0E99|nr:SufS family cysteine desulfurase [uncultured Sphaerochaeta sp.]